MVGLMNSIKRYSPIPLTVFLLGDLVQLYAIDAAGEHGPIYTGIYIGWDHEDDGWIIKTNGKLEVFPTTWWICKKV